MRGTPSARGRQRGGVLARIALLHLAVAVVLGIAWWRLSPQVTYLVVDGQTFPRGEPGSGVVFAADGLFVLLGAVAGVVCAAVVLLRGVRGAMVPAALAAGGLGGSLLGWWLGVTLGPGRLDTLVATAGDADVVAGPELNAYGALLVWPITAVAVVLVATALSAPERRSAPSVPE